jgi:hypothetical protein
MGVVTGVKDYPARLTKDLSLDSRVFSKLRIRLSDEWGASERSSLRSRRRFVGISEMLLEHEPRPSERTKESEMDREYPIMFFLGRTSDASYVARVEERM